MRAGSTCSVSPVATIAAGHAVHDTFTAFLPPLLPVLINNFLLSKTEAGLLSVFMQAPSLLQQFCGVLGTTRTREEYRSVWSAHFGLVTMVDECIGRVVQALKDNEIWLALAAGTGDVDKTEELFKAYKERFPDKK